MLATHTKTHIRHIGSSTGPGLVIPIIRHSLLAVMCVHVYIPIPICLMGNAGSKSQKHVCCVVFGLHMLCVGRPVSPELFFLVLGESWCGWRTVDASSFGAVVCPHLKDSAQS